MSQFGIDPELFVMKKGGRLATSIHLLKDFKEITSHTSTTTGRVWSKMDGFAFEFSSSPTGCRDYLIPAIANGIRDFHEAHEDYKLSAKASLPLTQRSVAGKPPLGVCEYGCVPDIDAFKLIEKTPEFESYQTLDRFTGGHIHYDLRKIYHNPVAKSTVTKKTRAAAFTLLLDIFVGVTMVAVIGNTNDYGEALRRTYYGQAGSHRVKNYGVEYRVLSGMFLSSPFMTTWALGAVRQVDRMPIWRDINVASDTKARTAIKELFKSHRLDEVQDIINNHDVKAARAYFNKFKGEGYRDDFVEGMIRADKKGLPINMNLMESWKMNGPNRAQHHNYPGVEAMMKVGERRVTKKQFPPRQAMELTARGW